MSYHTDPAQRRSITPRLKRGRKRLVLAAPKKSCMYDQNPTKLPSMLGIWHLPRALRNEIIERWEVRTVARVATSYGTSEPPASPQCLGVKPDAAWVSMS